MAVKESPVFSSYNDTQFQRNTDKQTVADHLVLSKRTETFATNNIETVYEENAPILLKKQGVIGVDIDYKLQPSINVFVNKNEYAADIPTQIGGFPVRVVTGKTYFA